MDVCAVCVGMPYVTYLWDCRFSPIYYNAAAISRLKIEGNEASIPQLSSIADQYSSETLEYQSKGENKLKAK